MNNKKEREPDEKKYDEDEDLMQKMWEENGNRRPFPDDAYIMRIVSELRALHEETLPKDKEKSEIGKYSSAQLSITKGLSLFHGLCGWAEDHIEGTVYNFYKNGKNHIDENSHKNEHFFIENIDEEENILWEPPPEAIREAKAAIFRNDILDLHGYAEMGRALLAYNEGEIHFFLKRTKKKTRGAKGNKPTLDTLKWVAVCYVHIVRGWGVKRIDACELISNNLGISIHALEKWEKEIGKAQDPEGEQRSKIRKYISSFVKEIPSLGLKDTESMSGYELITQWLERNNNFDEMERYITFIQRLYENHPIENLKKNLLLASRPAGKVVIQTKEDPMNGVLITPE